MNKAINGIVVPNGRIIKKDNETNISEEKIVIGANLLDNNEQLTAENEILVEDNLLANSDINTENLSDIDDEPTIIIDKENGRITKIKVMCSCGRHAQLECEYPNDEENLLP